MNAAQLELYLNNLGRPHEVLVSDRVIAANPLIQVYPHSLNLYLEPEPGLSLAFWAETKIFESLIISIAKMSPATVMYEADLSSPYNACINRAQTITLLGEPIESKGSFKMPNFTKEFGGWDKFEVPGGEHININVAVYYDSALHVVKIAFSLKKRAAEMESDKYMAEKGSLR